MKNPKKYFCFFNVLLCSILVLFTSCKKENTQTKTLTASAHVVVDETTKSYWYNGLAEISSFELTQQRYGEERRGKAVLIYVTEDFDHQQLVKADRKKEGDYPILKLNSTKSFTTGIYPYHIMQSSFLPMEKNAHVTKISASIQEWCGQSFMMLEHNDEFDIQINSYFQKIGNQRYNLPITPTENGLWNQLRLFPTQIDTTASSMLPSFEYLRLYNIKVKSYSVTISQQNRNGIIKTQLVYPELNRKLLISQEAIQPYAVLEWEESITQNDSTYLTKAKKIAEMRVDYWNKNQTKYTFLRDSLKL